MGLVVLGGLASGAAYSDRELEFIVDMCSHTGTGLRNAALSASLMESERKATTGRVALELAHDLGKDLDWMRRLIRRLPRRIEDRNRFERDVQMIGEFAEGALMGLKKFVDDATAASRDPLGTIRLPELADQAIMRMTRIHGGRRISRSLDPALREVRFPENLVRVLANLLDNALLASADEDSVHLFATRDDEVVRMTITDRGEGIPEAVLKEAFEPGFSTRGDGWGMGIGLTVSREIVRGLGGSMSIQQIEARGTRVTVVLPIRREGSLGSNR